MKKTILILLVILTLGFLALIQKLGVFTKPENESFENSTTAVRPTLSNQPTISKPAALYKDGAYTGKITDAVYGDYQVKAIISNGKISDIQFLKYPNDRGHSIEVSNVANPALKQEAIISQNANVDIVTGATQTSIAFKQSLQSALDQAL